MSNCSSVTWFSIHSNLIGKNILIADLPKDFIKAVVDLLKDDDKRFAIEKGAQSFAETEFDNTKVVAGLVNFYKEKLNG